MDSLTSKAAYLKGLADGMKLDSSKDENKLLLKIVEIIDDIAESVDDVCYQADELEEMVSDIDEDLHDVEEIVYDLDDEDDDLEDDDNFDIVDYDDDEDMGFFEIQCPNCNEDVMVDFDALDDDAPIICPNCHEEIELEFDCDCDCDDCHHDDE